MKKAKNYGFEPTTALEYLELIMDISEDYDGYNTVDGLKELIDEITGYANKAYDILSKN